MGDVNCNIYRLQAEAGINANYLTRLNLQNRKAHLASHERFQPLQAARHIVRFYKQEIGRNCHIWSLRYRFYDAKRLNRPLDAVRRN